MKKAFAHINREGDRFGGVVYEATEDNTTIFFFRPIWDQIKKARALISVVAAKFHLDIMYQENEGYYEDLALSQDVRQAMKVLKEAGYSIAKTTPEKVKVLVIRSQETHFWGGMVFDSKDKLVYELPMINSGQKATEQALMSWVERKGYHCPEVEVRS